MIEGVKASALTDTDNSGGLSAGDTLTYTVTATNIGNVTLSGVAVQSDTLTQMDTTASANSLSSFTAGSSTTLAPGGSVSFTATYLVAQADIDAGGLSNTATVVGTPPSGSANNVTDVTDDGDDQDGNTSNDATENAVTASPSIEGVKTVALTTDTGPSGLSAGDTLTYTIAIANTGNVTLTGVGVQSDTLSRGAGGTLSTVSGFSASNFTTSTSPATLAPGASLTYTATYLVAQADIDAGGLSNTATVIGTSPSGSAVTDVTDEGNDTDGNTTDDATTLTVSAAPVVMASQSFSYAENQVSGAVVGTVSATDDVGVTAFRFAATGTGTSADGYYSIASDGKITLTSAGATAGASSNDFETSPNSFIYGVQAGDAAGNWSSSENVTLNVTDVDDTAPTIALTSDVGALKAGETATITFTLSEASSDFAAGDITVTGGTLGTLTATGNPLVYTAVFTPTASSATSASISVASTTFSDAAGNFNADGADADNTVSIGWIELTVFTNTTV